MQVEAIVRAACVRTKAGEEVRPEIMVPLVGTEAEMVRLREMISAVVDRVLKEEGVDAGDPDRHHDRGAAGRPDGRQDRRATPTSSPSAPTT